MCGRDRCGQAAQPELDGFCAVRCLHSTKKARALGCCALHAAARPRTKEFFESPPTSNFPPLFASPQHQPHKANAVHQNSSPLNLSFPHHLPPLYSFPRLPPPLLSLRLPPLYSSGTQLSPLILGAILLPLFTFTGIYSVYLTWSLQLTSVQQSL